MAFHVSANQLEISFGDDSLKQVLTDLAEQVKRGNPTRGKPRPTKSMICSINLELPLLFTTVFDARYEYVVEEEEDEERKRINAQELIEVREEMDDLLKHKLLDIRDIARLAAGILYSDISLLLNGSGKTEHKREILEWMFADKYFGEVKPMNMIPFTCQFCCELEEIDYELLCDVFAHLIESAPEDDGYRLPESNADIDIPQDESLFGLPNSCQNTATQSHLH